jgi:hypothetical protein
MLREVKPGCQVESPTNTAIHRAKERVRVSPRRRSEPLARPLRRAGFTIIQETAMAYADLSEFVAALERAGELRRVTSEVDPILEITEITDRVSKQGGRRSSSNAWRAPPCPS